MTDDVILTLSLLLSAALVARFVASMLPVPEILVLVAIGALLGTSALDVIDVPLDSLGAQLLFTLGVSLILFYGGLSLSLPVLRRVWVGLGLLVVPGVVLTAAVVGVAAYLVFDLSWTAALLMGAVLAPTDPAILIPLFVRSRLRPKVAQTVIAESAFNDPTGAALALTLAGVLLSGDGSLGQPVAEFLVDLLISTVIGVVAGIGLAAAISSHRSGVWRESSALAVLTVVTISFFSLDSAGGSGYLGRVPGRADRGQHGAPGPGDALPARAGDAPVRVQHRRPGHAVRVRGARGEHPVRARWARTCCRRWRCWRRCCSSRGR